MDPQIATPEPRMPPAVPRRRRHRLLKTFAALLLLFVLALLALPWLASADWSRRRIEAALSGELQAEVHLDAVHASWWSGFGLDGLVIANAAGFDSSHPFLQLSTLRFDFSFWRALRGQVSMSGEVQGLRLYVDQLADGRTNYEVLFHKGAGRGSAPAPRPSSGPNVPVPANDNDLLDMLQSLQLDVTATDVVVEIRRDGKLMESVRDASLELTKALGATLFKVDADATLGPPTAAPGKVMLHADAEARDRTFDAALSTTNLQLQRYQPLVDALLPADALHMSGVVTANLQARVVDGAEGRRLVVDGDATVTAPDFSGTLLQGMRLVAPKWSLAPKLLVALDADDQPLRIDATQFAADLGCLQLQGLDAAATKVLLGDQQGLGFDCRLDVDALASYGGPMPSELRNIGGVVQGQLALPLHGAAMPPLQQLLASTRADAKVQLRQLSFAGFSLQQLDSVLKLSGGKIELSTGTATLLNQGPLQFTLSSDLQQRDTLPFRLSLHWQGGKVDGQTSELLRYAVPLLAGLQDNTASFTSGIDLSLELQGTALPQTGQNWLQLLNTWRGSGNVALADGELLPAPALQSLLGLLGQQKKLAIDKLSGAFTMQQGTIETKVMRWISKGQDYGLSGKVGLDGALDFGLDLTALLKQHKDGAKIAAVLGNQKLMAGLAGNLDAPRLGLPDLGSLLGSALQQEAQKLLKDKAGNAVQKALEDLLHKSRKKQ